MRGRDQHDLVPEHGLHRNAQGVQNDGEAHVEGGDSEGNQPRDARAGEPDEAGGDGGVPEPKPVGDDRPGRPGEPAPERQPQPRVDREHVRANVEALRQDGRGEGEARREVRPAVPEPQ